MTTTVSAPRPSDAECISSSGGSYQSTTGAKFDMICGVNFNFNDIFLNYTLDYRSCIDGCAVWNTNSTEVCVGIGYAPGNYGPSGVQGGSQCFYKWQMPGLGTYTPGIDSARLQIDAQTTMVPSC
jgi:hypothetical protein